MATILMAIDLRYTEEKNQDVLIGLSLICPGPSYFENIENRVKKFGNKLEVLALMANVEGTEVLEELIAFATSYKTMILLCNSNDITSVAEKHELSEYESGDDDYSTVDEGKFSNVL